MIIELDRKLLLLMKIMKYILKIVKFYILFYGEYFFIIFCDKVFVLVRKMLYFFILMGNLFI